MRSGCDLLNRAYARPTLAEVFTQVKAYIQQVGRLAFVRQVSEIEDASVRHELLSMLDRVWMTE